MVIAPLPLPSLLLTFHGGLDGMIAGEEASTGRFGG
jgi:hypothetical protein